MLSVFQVLHVVLGRVFPTEEVLGGAGEAKGWEKLQRAVPRMLFAIRHLGLGLPVLPAESPPPSLTFCCLLTSEDCHDLIS